MEHPYREVRIDGAVARASVAMPARVQPRNIGPLDITPKFRTVREASDIDRELGNPGDQHHCPLCEEYFGWEAFKAHAPQCIAARAPRGRVWTPPGFSANAVQAYPDKVRMD